MCYVSYWTQIIPILFKTFFFFVCLIYAWKSYKCKNLKDVRENGKIDVSVVVKNFKKLMAVETWL